MPLRSPLSRGRIEGVRLRVLSLGAGVQSSTLALMASRGEIGPMPDCAIFADTGAEPAKVYVSQPLAHGSIDKNRLPPIFRFLANGLPFVIAVIGASRSSATLIC